MADNSSRSNWPRGTAYGLIGALILTGAGHSGTNDCPKLVAGKIPVVCDKSIHPLHDQPYREHLHIESSERTITSSDAILWSRWA